MKSCSTYIKYRTITEREVQQAAEIEKYQRDLESSRIQCLQQQSQINALQV